MSGKAFLGLLLVVVLLGGGLGGAYVGGYTLGERKGKSEAEASASSTANQASQQLQQLREQFQTQFGQGGQFQSVQGTPQPGGQGRLGAGSALAGGQVGAIERIENGKLTLNTARGLLEATLSTNTTIEKTSTGTLADLKVGTQVAVVGQRDDSGVIQARSITIVPEGTGGFLGSGGQGTPTPR